MPPNPRQQRFEQAREQLGEYLSRNGLKHTRQRDTILEAFLDSKGHITSEDLYEQVRANHPEIGAATVYRTLKLLVDAGLANAASFREGVTVYEPDEEHHDHLICLGCGEIIEFHDATIERRQVEIAKKHGYRMRRHRHHLYGYCARCQAKGLDSR